MHRPFKSGLAVSAFIATLLSACATNPEKLSIPTQPLCVRVPETLTSVSQRGIGVTWTLGITKGLYVTEKEDDEGVFFRGPEASTLGGPIFGIGDGGFWIPKDPTVKPRLYLYLGNRKQAANNSTEVPECSDVAAIRDVVANKLSLTGMTASGAIGGAQGRAAVAGSSMSYGQAAVGGAAGMLIVGALINSDSGKIQFIAPLDDAMLEQKLRDFASKATPVKLLPALPSGDAGKAPQSTSK